MVTHQVATLPFDTAKVRLQIRNSAVGGAAPAVPVAGGQATGGLFSTLVHIGKTEGVTSLFKGLTPGIHRQLLFGSIRLGSYEPVR